MIWKLHYEKENIMYIEKYNQIQSRIRNIEQMRFNEDLKMFTLSAVRICCGKLFHSEYKQIP